MTIPLPNWLDLTNKCGLVVGIANEHSIAYGCARVLRELGAEVAVTYLNAKAEPHVRPLAEALRCPIILPLDVEAAGEMEAVFSTLAERWGCIDFLVHAIAFAPKDCLHERVLDCRLANFQRAIDVSCHSFVRMAKLAEPLMNAGGSLITMSYYGAEKAMPQYKVMGPVKAALESFVRYLAEELAAPGIRVYAVSPGPMPTRAASGIPGFDALAQAAIGRSPQHRLVDLDDVGRLTAFLVSDAAQAMTGDTLYVDGGFHIMA